MAKSTTQLPAPARDRHQYEPGPEYELVQSGSTAAEPADSSDTWLLQLPHHWSTSVQTEIQMRFGSGQTTTATCNDDEGTTYAVEVEACKAGQPVYVLALRSGQVQLQPCSRRATWIHSQAVLASHEAAAADPASLPTARKQASSIPPPASDQKPTEAARALQNGEKAGKKRKKKKHEGKQANDERTKVAKVKKAKKAKD